MWHVFRHSLVCIFIWTGESTVFEFIEDGLKYHNYTIKEDIPFHNCVLAMLQAYFGNNGLEDDVQVRQAFHYQHLISNLIDNFEIPCLASDNNFKYSLMRLHKPKDSTSHWDIVTESDLCAVLCYLKSYVLIINITRKTVGQLLTGASCENDNSTNRLIRPNKTIEDFDCCQFKQYGQRLAIAENPTLQNGIFIVS